MKISKKIVSGWGFELGTIIALTIVTVCAIFLYTKQGSDTYEFICMKT
jgi:hypothetical protein